MTRLSIRHEPNHADPPSERGHDQPVVADPTPPAGAAQLSDDLAVWCYLLGSMPSGWDVTPPFYPELGGSWTIVGFNTRRHGPSPLPSFLVGRGDEPTPAVIDLANQFVAWSERAERSATFGR
jgi:hypothetical protein